MTAQNKNRPDESAKGAAAAPDVTDAHDMKKIRRVDLDLHSDGIDHWQDEPQPDPDKAKERGAQNKRKH